MLGYAFVRPESEQNCSLLTRGYIRVHRNMTLSDRDALMRSLMQSRSAQESFGPAIVNSAMQPHI